MNTVTVALGERSYPIHIGAHLLKCPDLIGALLPQRRAALITDSNVAPLYLDALARTLASAGIGVVPIILPAGEQQKNWQTLNQLYDALLAAKCERRTALIALGGGVVGDLTGFAAATFLRGVPYVQIPTTLLAQVDSSVGGKTGINHPLGKNMIGAFYQPLLVVADTATLATLPQREYSAGLAEVIKYGLIRDLSLFEWLEANMARLTAREGSALAIAIERSCRMKAEVVAEDERETGARALLNLGHTFGHAIEAGTGYGRWLHGEAVAAGTVLAADLSRRMGFIGAEEVARIRSLFAQAGLPVDAPALGVSRYRELMALDKKVEGGKTRLILLRELGQAFVEDAAPAALLDEVLAIPPAHV
jgi:3-dehydroquinate synthase